MNHSSEHAILIVTHNHSGYISKLIDSCREIKHIKKYICDAASTDGTDLLLEAAIRDDDSFELIKKSELEGFSKNNNDLVREFFLQGKNLILINPDCYFEKDSLLKFLDTISTLEELGVAAPTLHYQNGVIQNSWRRFPSFWGFVKNRFSKSKATTNNHILREIKRDIFEIEWALGAFLYISSTLTKQPPLDERYRLYCEDSDICMKAHSLGLKVIGINIPGFYHALQEKSSTKLLSKYNYWNICSGFLFAAKWNATYLKINGTLKRKMSVT
ncbi:hypothetical protein DK254_25695 [Pseudomonas sp. RW407]|uniref:glycosyltransferase family 2 protein n=1 Tax=Pseudomonas sp. RW407 TaxID=2202894 RepID=UPI000D6EDDE6|nr:glycosyltransferase [Pseudomonas sp. RW407]PWU26010.1 hypothetical protein DK254_25695 [Pseudomonas sp. RW407]